MKTPSPPPPPTRSKPTKKRQSRRALQRELDAARGRERVYALEVSSGAAVQAAVMRGFLLYMEHPGLTIRQVYEHFRVSSEPDADMISSVCSWVNFHRWATRNHWTRKRDEHWANVEVRVLEHLQTDHVQQELTEVAALAEIGSRLLLHIHGGTDDHGRTVKGAQPKSLEGAVKAYLDMDKLRSAKRERIAAATAAASTVDPAGEVVTGDLTHMGGVSVPDKMSPEEIKAMEQAADMIAAKRAGMEPELFLLESDDDARGDEPGSTGEE